ncbi:retrotransposon protein, putative, ty1-copia subclass [Tanacetum coccineum]
MFVIEHPIPPALAADSTAQVLTNWNAVYDAHNEELKSMFETQAEVERFDLIQTLHACKQEEGKSVCSYVLKMKGYVEKLEHLGYVLQQDLSTIGELHALLIEYEKGLPKKATTPQLMTIQGEHPTKDDACHHCKEVGHCKRNYPAYHAELIKKKKKVGTASSLVSKNDVLYFNVIPRDGIYEIDMLNLVPNVNSIYNVRNKRAKHNLDFTYLWHCRLTHISKKYMHQDKVVATPLPLRMIIVVMLTPPYTPQYNRVSERRNHTLLDMVRSMMNLTTLPLSYWDYALESATSILNMVPTKKVDKTPYELWYGKVPNLSYLKATMGYYFYFPPENKIVIARYAEFLEKNLISQKFSGRAEELEEIQDEDTSPSENTSEIPMEQKSFTQTYEVDYEETFSPVANIRAIRIFIAIAAFYDYEIWQIDVKTTFLNGYLDEDIYMVQPEGFIDPEHHRKTVVKTILKYLRNTKDMFLVYGGNPEAELRVDCYCDAGFEIDSDDIKSHIGYVFILNGGAIDWKSSKQSTTAMLVMSIWEVFGGNTYTLDSIWEETGQDCNSTRRHSRFCFQTVETSSHFLVRTLGFSQDDIKIHPDDVKLTDSEEVRRRFAG